MKKKYVSRLLAGCLTVTMLTPTGALASVPQPVVTQEASQVAGQENETENKEQAEEYAKTWEPDTWFVVNTATRRIEAYGLPG